MERLISLVNKLQLSRAALGEESALPALSDLLPSIAVVGGQSSGKSSVLERIVGRDFLPKGPGIVTRCPLVLQLHHGIDGTGEYAEFLHQPGKRFTDFAEVRKEISDETDRATGWPKAISSVPIRLSIFSPNVVNLTLIDIPGLTNVVVEGQSDSIVQDIENMVRAFIEKPNCIILAVSPANEDLATSDAMKISQEVDPKGERTFGVLTKIDLMDKGTNAVDILEGRTYRLQFPWFGVVNRSQEDINQNVGMLAARNTEHDYFANTPEYKHLAHRMGSEYLAKSLSKHLASVIKSRIPASHLFNDLCINPPDAKKTMLQEYTLRAYGKYPMYQLDTEGEPHNMIFKCTVQVQDQKFMSETHHRHRKDAEEDAASVAYKALMGDESMEKLLHIINQGSMCLVSTLNEYSLKKLSKLPVYASSLVAAKSKMDLWVSTVILDGETYIGDNAGTKRLSAQKAAATAIQTMLEDGDDLMIKHIQAKRRNVLCLKKRRKDAAQLSAGAPVRKTRKLLDELSVQLAELPL